MMTLMVAVTVEAGKPMQVDWAAINEFAKQWVCRTCGLRSIPSHGVGCSCGRNDWVSAAEYDHIHKDEL